MRTFDLHIGSKVHCTDQECGSLAHVVINPKTQEATEIVVAKGILFMKNSRALPINLVKSATEAAIHLSLHSRELENYPEYYETVVEEPDPTIRATSVVSSTGYAEYSTPMIRRRLRRGIPSDMAIVSSNTPMEISGKTLGYVDHVLVDQTTRTIKQVVMRTGLLLHDYLVVPIGMIESVGDHVYLDSSQKNLSAFPHYEKREAHEVLADVRKSLAAEPETYGAVQATMEDGVLQLSGLVRSRTIKYHAEQVVQSIEGVIDIDNNLMVDPNLEMQTAGESAHVASQIHTALSADQRTSDAVIEVIDDGGIIILQGVVEDVATRTAAEEIAAQQTGVISVVNELVVLRQKLSW